MTSVDSDPGRPRSFCSRTLQLKIKSRLCNANAHTIQKHSASLSLRWRLFGPSDEFKFNSGLFFRKCSTSSCACAELSTIFVGLPPPASTANLFPVCEWTQPWRLTRYWRHLEVLLTVNFSNASLSWHMVSTLVRLL